EQAVDALAGGHLALRVLSLDGALRTGVQRLLLALSQLLEPLLHWVVGHRRGGYRGAVIARRCAGVPQPDEIHWKNSDKWRSERRGSPTSAGRGHGFRRPRASNARSPPTSPSSSGWP